MSVFGQEIEREKRKETKFNFQKVVSFRLLIALEIVPVYLIYGYRLKIFFKYRISNERAKMNLNFREAGINWILNCKRISKRMNKFYIGGQRTRKHELIQEKPEYSLTVKKVSKLTHEWPNV